MSTAADDGQAPAAAAPPAAGDADARLKAMEDEQRRQGALLERIAAGGGAGTPAAVPDKPEAKPASLAEQVRQEIAAADERRKAEESEKTWRADVNETLEKVRAEHAPREPEKGFRATLQRLLIGRPD